MKRFLSPSLLLAAAIACSSSSTPSPEARLDAIADTYVRLVLALGEHDPDYVDAYFGPEEWRSSAAQTYPTLDTIREAGERLFADLPPAAIADPVVERRRRSLNKRLTSLVARADMLSGRRFTFDEETRLLYDAVAPDYDSQHFQAVIDALDALLPGQGSVQERSTAFRGRFVVPPERLAAVFDAAIAECRRRTLEHISLPGDERFVVEYVTDKPWSGYNWYQGSAFSLIQINTDLPIYIDRAVDLGCHEGYPGHHTYHTLLERELFEERGWIEYSIYPLFSPQAPISEGAANYGIELAFPGDERAQFEKTRLFPLAGLDPAEADRYYRYLELREELSYARNEAARDYLDGRLSRVQAVEWLMTYGLMTAEEADKALSFIQTYRGYVINYNLGQDVVRAHVEGQAGDDRVRRWEVFRELLSVPASVSDLTGSVGRL